MEIIAVKSVDEVLKIALTKNLKRVDWVEVEQISKTKSKRRDQKHTLILNYLDITYIIEYKLHLE